MFSSRKAALYSHRMKRLLALIVGLGLCFAAAAQQYRWVDQNGRVQYGDVPPPGVKATRLRGASGAAAAPASPEAASAAPAKPLTPAEQEAAFRKRQLDSQKAAEKADEASRESSAKKEQCARAKEYQATVASGQRLSRTDASGERYYLDEAQTAQEAARAGQMVQQACN